MALVLFSVPRQYVGNKAGGGSHQDERAVHMQPVVAGRRRVQAMSVPLMDNIAAVMVVMGRQGVSVTEVAVGRMPGI